MSSFSAKNRKFTANLEWNENSTLPRPRSNHPTPRAPTRMKNWIRGVNLGGWLVLERFITPYLFAITSCHLAGNFCYYPGQIGAPSVESDDYVLCPSVKECKPILQKNPRTGKQDYPVDEYSLVQAFGENHLALSSYLQHHYDTFITRQDIVALAHAGVTHVRVPMPHWILLKNEDSNDDEEYPWIVDNAMWLHFVRLVDWCREYGIEVWPDLHTAPGSQNGFDNSGRLNGEGATCDGWNDSPTNINRTLEALQKICVEIHNDGLRDVVTGISVLNEPYMDCDEAIVREYNKKALNIVRNVLGNTTAVVIGDMFNATLWDNGFWQNTPHTYLDSHYYHGKGFKMMECIQLMIDDSLLTYALSFRKLLQSLPRIRALCHPSSTWR